MRKPRKIEGLQLLTQDELAQLLQVTTRTIRAMCDRGELKKIVIGRLIRFDLDDVKAMLNAMKTGGSND